MLLTKVVSLYSTTEVNVQFFFKSGMKLEMRVSEGGCAIRSAQSDPETTLVASHCFRYAPLRDTRAFCRVSGCALSWPPAHGKLAGPAWSLLRDRWVCWSLFSLRSHMPQVKHLKKCKVCFCIDTVDIRGDRRGKGNRNPEVPIKRRRLAEITTNSPSKNGRQSENFSLTSTREEETESKATGI